MSAIETSRLTEAAAWRVRLAQNELEDDPQFAAWIAADPRNAAAWDQVQDSWKVFGEHATSPEIIELRCRALAHAHEAGRGRWVRSKRFAMAHRLAIAACILAVAIGASFLWSQQADVYSTRAGERRVVTLADGSQVALDSKSEVKVRYSADARELTLTRGQARFDVAHDIERPFSVTARSHKVIATGTSFNVDLFGPSLLVTLIEGHVVVSSSAPMFRQPTNIDVQIEHIALDAGEQVVFTPKAPPSVAHVNLGQATAWENGEVVFENDPLPIVVARINRYARHGVVIADAQTSELRISGVFHTGDIDGFVSTIAAYLPVRADKTADGTTRLAHR
ncbi:MAG: FecR family protein [Steroidobacteraceae bacterium]